MGFYVTRQYLEMIQAEREREIRELGLARLADRAAECADAGRRGLLHFLGLGRPQAVQPATCSCQ